MYHIPYSAICIILLFPAILELSAPSVFFRAYHLHCDGNLPFLYLIIVPHYFYYFSPFCTFLLFMNSLHLLYLYTLSFTL